MDIYGAYIGCSSLYVIQTNSVIQPYKNLNDTWNLANDLRNGNKHVNWEKVKYWGPKALVIGGTVVVTALGTPAAGAAYYYGASALIIGGTAWDGYNGDHYGSWFQ